MLATLWPLAAILLGSPLSTAAILRSASRSVVVFLRCLLLALHRHHLSSPSSFPRPETPPLIILSSTC